MNLLFRRARRDERGFTMLTVMMVMLVAGLFVAGAYAASDGDLPLGKQSRDSKAAYAAAEAGIQYYAYHVAQDPDYWTKCATVPAPNPGEPNPVTSEWYDGAPDTRTGHWRNVPGASSTYAVELLAAKDPTAAVPMPQCTVGDQTSMLDPATGTFRIRSTGRAGNETRSIVASFRRPSFLDFLYFTDFETWDPAVYTSLSDQTNATTQCDDYHGARAGWCQEITFPGNDQILGPFHSNDFVHFGSGTDVGRPGKNDKLESSQNAPSYDGAPSLAATWKSGQIKLPVPTSNAELKAVATPALTFTGRTTLRFNGSTVTWARASDGATGSASLAGTNGVIYVKNATATACAGVKSPQLADYGEGTGCGNAYVSGTYNTSFTLTTDNDIILAPPVNSSDANLKRDPSSDAVAGLVASNFVRVGHRVTRTAYDLSHSPETSCTNVNTAQYPVVGDVTIEAAVLAVAHSFLVDNFGCGSPLGTVHIKGALAQKFRGRLAGSGTSSGGVTAGYLKDYQYDDRLKYRSPPFFLSPVVSAWHIVRQNEQVPAR
jgi:Tfp pilus assembly protein PilX